MCEPLCLKVVNFFRCALNVRYWTTHKLKLLSRNGIQDALASSVCLRGRVVSCYESQRSNATASQGLKFHHDQYCTPVRAIEAEEKGIENENHGHDAGLGLVKVAFFDLLHASHFWASSSSPIIPALTSMLPPNQPNGSFSFSPGSLAIVSHIIGFTSALRSSVSCDPRIAAGFISILALLLFALA
ncbi:hypothetical protein BC827DRAFT_860211 [Russula dissimulans]|nr:hypothetical protein BC827DRAFT_860211 [Russula dissimulans]